MKPDIEGPDIEEPEIALGTGTGPAAPAVPEPFILREATAPAVPVLLTSPHSGRLYPEAFLAASRLNRLAIRRSEDSYVEELFASAPGLGMPLLAATFPRAYCDANREAWELDPEMFEDRLPEHVNMYSPRVAAGLGTIARIVATGETIYRRKLEFAEAERRVRQCWQPFHDELERRIAATVRNFGACLLIDCHSMPCGDMTAPVDIVLGDNYGTACAPKITAFVEMRLRRLGFTVGRNIPYAGGYITRHYGRPAECVHVLQIEVARALYMNERRIERNADFPRLAQRLEVFLTSLGEMAQFLLPGTLPQGLAPAAE